MVALACQLPAATGVPLSRWTGPGLLAEITRAGTAGQISVSSVLRILAGHPVKPWQYQSWIAPRDPDFAAKATVILDLYQGFYKGRRLWPGDRILSVDAKPSIQARSRCRPAARGKPVRAGHEYVRHGALALLAAAERASGYRRAGVQVMMIRAVLPHVDESRSGAQYAGQVRSARHTVRGPVFFQQREDLRA